MKRIRVASRRRGMTAVLAMLFLMLFSALAIGFYSSTTMSVQVAKNERASSDAMMAAESGLQFMRYQLGNVNIADGTTDANLLSALASELGRLMNNTGNMGGNTVQASAGAIQIPSATSTIPVNPGVSGFRATVTTAGAFVILNVKGTAGLISRTVQVKFQKASRASAIFNYGVASKGKIVTGGSAIIVGLGDPTRGSVLSTNLTDSTPVVIGGKEVSGDISIVNANGTVTYAGAKIGGTTNAALIAAEHIHKGVKEPAFPTVDTTVFANYATNQYTNGNTLDNAYIPPNTNPTFTGNTTIKGVLLVKAPNRVEFRGNTSIQGVIVVENAAPLNLAANKLTFSGSVSATGVDTLPASYGGLRSLTGAFLLANNFAVTFTGDFGTLGGSIIASQITMSGNSGGTVKGSVINMNNVPMTADGSADIIIASTGTSNYPPGVTFGTKFAPLPGTYVELQ